MLSRFATTAANSAARSSVAPVIARRNYSVMKEVPMHNMYRNPSSQMPHLKPKQTAKAGIAVPSAGPTGMMGNVLGGLGVFAFVCVFNPTGPSTLYNLYKGTSGVHASEAEDGVHYTRQKTSVVRINDNKSAVTGGAGERKYNPNAYHGYLKTFDEDQEVGLKRAVSTKRSVIA